MEPEYGILTLEICPELEREIIELFDIEIEMMQAEVEIVSENIKRYTIKIPCHKGGRIRDYILKSISNSEQLSLN